MSAVRASDLVVVTVAELARWLQLSVRPSDSVWRIVNPAKRRSSVFAECESCGRSQACGRELEAGGRLQR